MNIATADDSLLISREFPFIDLTKLQTTKKETYDIISILTRSVSELSLPLAPHYTPPLRADMAIILVFFNPARSVRIIQNLLTVKFWLDRSQIPCFIGELAHNDTPFIFTEAPNICQFRSESLMFYKENLIKAVEKIIPPQFTKLFFMDADILYKDPAWYDVVSSTLDHYDVCQPFQTAHMLNIDYSIRSSMTSIFDVDPTEIKLEFNHPGYCWAMSRDWYHRTKPTDFAVIGGGDLMFYKHVTKNLFIQGGAKETEIYGFMDPIISALPGAASYCSCPLTIVHLNHGTITNRQFHNRAQSVLHIVQEIDPTFTLLDVLERRSDGILEWKSEYRPLFNRYYATFFANRCDDSSATGEIASRRLKFYPTKYTTPTNTDMAVLLVFFNPVNYFRPTQNILTTKHWLDAAGIPVFIVELATNDIPFLFPPSPSIFQVRSSSFMFYKENLIYYALRKIPEAFKKICVMDADIFYDTPNWYSIISHSLDMYNVLQPFKNAFWLDIDYTIYRSRTNAVDHGKSKISWDHHHPGFLYAFDRDTLNSFHLEDRTVFTPGGDCLLSDLVCGRSLEQSTLSTLFHKENLLNVLCDKPGLHIGSCSLNIYHFNHGARKNRNFFELRQLHKQVIKLLDTSVLDSVLERRHDGILEWNSTYRKLYNRIMLSYFSDRKEDLGDTEEIEDFHTTK
jgi:hypothetical protein